jgi:radical SAM superfamily enzyme YgiQ (UPF0313 family)
LNVLTPELAERMAACGMKSVTAAPEAATFHLRKMIGKAMTDEAVMGGMNLLARAGVKRIKLYFMVGLPNETDRDAAAVVDMVKRMREEIPAGIRLSISLAPFVPKPDTPLAREPMADRTVLKSRIALVRSGLGRMGGVEIRTAGLRESMIEALLSRGDRRLGGWLERVVLEGGNRFRSLKEFGVDPGWINAPVEETRPLPGDLTGISTRGNRAGNS